MVIKPWTKNCVCGWGMYTRTPLGGEGSGKLHHWFWFCFVWMMPVMSISVILTTFKVHFAGETLPSLSKAFKALPQDCNIVQ